MRVHTKMIFYGMKLLIVVMLLSLVSIQFLAEGEVPTDPVLIDFNIDVDGGALQLWERILRTYGNRMLILKINSYGGYLSVADRIVSDIIEKNMLCYTWIPPGGRAVSAAAMIALSCRGIFMGSGSVIGDAIPIPTEPKVVEYVASRFRALAERLFKGNESLVEIAEAMVRTGKTLTAEKAIAIGFALRAENVNDLENMLNVKIMETINPSTWDRFVSLISLPIVTNILLIAGMLLIVTEILTTGFQGYGVAGALLIGIALYGMNIIPPNLFALILMLVGLALIVIEMYTPGFGVFGLSGIAVLAIGLGYQLYLTPPQMLTEPVYAFLGGMVMLTLILGFVAFKAIQSNRRKRISLEQQLLTSIGIAKTDIYRSVPGVVYVLGEDWTAYSVDNVIPAGSKVKIIRIEGLKLYVKKVDQD